MKRFLVSLTGLGLLGSLFFVACSSSSTPNDALLIVDEEVIYTISTDDWKRTKIFESGEDKNRYSPSWSPNGDSILFQVRDGDEDQLFVMDADGANLTQLTFLSEDESIHHPSLDYFPTWSPNGDSILFEVRDGDEDQLFVMDADGANLTQLIALDKEKSIDWPSWSPNGDSILFKAYVAGEGSQLFVIDADGTNLTQLTFLEENKSFELRHNTRFSSPSWSPNSDYIMFKAYVPDEGYQLFVMDADGTNFIVLNEDEFTGHPSWSPNGDYILLEDGYQLFVMDADGANLTQLTFLEENKVIDRPLWSPNGDSILFQVRDGDEDQLFVMDADGDNLTQLTFLNEEEILSHLSWSPSGEYIQFNVDGEYKIFDLMEKMIVSIGSADFMAWGTGT